MQQCLNSIDKSKFECVQKINYAVECVCTHACVFFCVHFCACVCVCVCVYIQVQHKATIIYAAAWVPAVQGPHKRPFVFQILCQTYFVCNFLHCCICTVSLKLHIGRSLRFIFAWNPYLS